MQLSAVERRARRGALASGLVASLALSAGAARADVVEIETAHTVHHESPTRTNMTVYTPGLSAKAKPAEWIAVKAGYEADVVSGASVAVKAGSAYQANNPGVDVVTAASVHDFRHRPSGALTLKKGDVTVTGGYAYSTENDYKSHALSVSAKTDVLDHNTQLELSYARNFDLVCDRVQSPNVAPTRARALEDSVGCFAGAALRTRHRLGVDALAVGWSQAWTPIFSTQLVYGLELQDGFLSNPYRSIVLGQGLRAQEHHPDDRARHSLALRSNLWIRPLAGVLRLAVRGYRDSWDLLAANVEVEGEKYVSARLRMGVRGRLYRQTGALFWSDDYTGGDPPLGPKGQYFTGDRELSPFTSVTAGVKASYTDVADERRVLGLFELLRLGVTMDVMQFAYDEYTLGGTPVGNARAYVASGSALVAF